MTPEEVIDLTDNEEDADSVQDFDTNSRRSLLFPIVTRVVDALGGVEGGAYRLGDEASSCLKDLKKLWRKDDDDDERTIARIFYETQVLPNDLIPILFCTAGRGLVEDKHAIACADLMTAMTWPIDMAEELKELDDELDKGTDYTQLLRSHLEYKAALLKPGVMQALFGIMLPPLAKAPRERTQRDGQIVNLVLHLIRNLAFIRDLHPSAYASADAAQFAAMQNQLVLTLHETHALRLVLTVAANADGDKLFESWNTLVLEIVYLLVRGVKPEDLTMDQAKQPAATLQKLLATEDRIRRNIAKTASSRHSRFGTTIAVTLNPKKQTPAGTQARADEPSSSSAPSGRSLVMHRQAAVANSAGSLLDIGKKQKGRKGLTVDELTREDNLSIEARKALQQWACDFLEECFNSFVGTLIKDIRSERPKITEKDHLRLLYVTKWFLEFFLAMRSKTTSDKEGKVTGKTETESKWNFGLVAQVTEREWIGWAFKRMRGAVEEKPKLWTELQAGIDCFTQLLLLLDAMASSGFTPTRAEDVDEEDDIDIAEQAIVLQQQLIYNGEILDLALESLRAYRPGTQSLKYLDASIGFCWALIRMVERMNKRSSTGVSALVRQRKVKKRKKKMKKEDEEDEEEDDGNESEIEIRETMFTFEAFEMKLANVEITNTLLTYLARYKEFTSSECMRRVVNLLHRQAVRAKAEGLFFNVSTLELFHTILADKNSFPREQPYKDLINLVNFLLRQFFKAVEKDSFLVVEAFFPKNRGHWKQYSSWEPEIKSSRRNKPDEGDEHNHDENSRGKGRPFSGEVRVKKGYSWSDQLGIAMASLTEAGNEHLVQWTKEILGLVIAQRRRIIDVTDKCAEDASGSEDEELTSEVNRNQPSAEATAKISDYAIPCVNDDQAQAVSKNEHLKLLFRLCKFAIRSDDGDETEWYVPAAVPVADLASTLVVVNQFIVTPFDLEGKKASQLLTKQTRRSRRRRKQSPSPEGEDHVAVEDEVLRKRDKKVKEKQQYKSAQFIEDSDEEYGDMEAFLQKEKVLREKAIAAAAEVGNIERPPGMRATGTKKRRRMIGDEGKGGMKRKRKAAVSDQEDGIASDAQSDITDEVRQKPRPRPKPRPLAKRIQLPPSRDKSPLSQASHSADEAPDVDVGRRNTKRLVLSDDEDDIE
ncbi:hypothetical protein AMATHDRAFT_151707 [Amanita thiersii Skay4041]|uniref:Timeless N-terminal domain-containing protein n=1 Tax=Amanita thiersii Skay4041 TaxID=703135 RepID=A0A2A9NH83_9AGAR|nr:hypothetical protein AMATHDRAFT_151707 [Amanita thiersii Skay4041]